MLYWCLVIYDETNFLLRNKRFVKTVDLLCRKFSF